MTRRLLCLHGHFYQPPRENPWIEEIEVQDSASPFHDWNTRITAECYGPNGAARVKDPDGRIIDILNNYRYLSFNFGPTLLAWLERHAPEVYGAILEADAASATRRGHGNAIAQGYNHAILPLCTPRDRRTQVRWGVRDFELRFGRRPEGFWLPETAADTATLAALVDEGIRFTVLSPYQAARVRAPGTTFVDASGGCFDPTRPYRVRLPGDRSIVVFFYDGPIARSIAFGEGLANGDELVRCLESGFDPGRRHDELLSVAVDGETFGHHKKGGDEALAAALRHIESRGDPVLINFAQALDLVPVEWEAEIVEGSSWSCVHGIERWRSDCGCEASGQPGWRQAWRAPLRDAFDHLRTQLSAIFEHYGRPLFLDPWAARDAYIELILDPAREEATEFLSRHADRPLARSEQVRALTLLEMQRQALLMYTSCGWFFSEVSGLETVQVLKYAARAIQLAREVSEVDLEPSFTSWLSHAPSNLSPLDHGGRVYDQHVMPSVVTLESVAAHWAIASLFDEHPESGTIFCYRYTVRSRRRETTGPATLAVGRLELSSLLTRRSLDASFCVLHFGGADFRCGLRPFRDGAEQAELERSLFQRLEKMSLAQVLREIDRAFTGRDYTLRDLFLDERRRMAARLLRETLSECEHDYERIYESNRRLMEFLREIDSPIPTALRVAADVGLTGELEHVATELEAGRIDLATARAEMLHVTYVARNLGARLDEDAVRPVFRRLIDGRIARLCDRGRPVDAYELVELLELALHVGVTLDQWSAQNRIWDWVKTERRELDDALLLRLARDLYFDEAALLSRARRMSPPDATPGIPRR